MTIILKTPIPLCLSNDLNSSVWNFDPPFIRSKEPARVIGIIAAHPTNPLYLVENSEGEQKAIYQQVLVDAGAVFH